MAAFCIPKKYLDNLKNSALRSEVKISEIIKMTSKERRAYFDKFVEPDVSKFINVEFEKALTNQREDALLDWAKGVFSPTEKGTPKYKNVLDKIKELKDKGTISGENLDNYLEDLVSDKMGVSITEEEAQKITVLANDIADKEKALGELQSKFGTLEGEKETTEFFLASRKMDDYLNSLVPSSRAKVFFSTIARGTMLASVKSPILNIGSNTLVGMTEALTRRLAEGKLGSYQIKVAKDYITMVNRIYQKTGYDVSRMTSLNDLVAGGGKTLGEVVTHSQGKGVIRRVGRFYEDIVFKQLMGAPDVAFSSAHFIDSAAITANKYAKGDKEIYEKVLSDSMRINPLTTEGRIVRDRAITDATVATWTNESYSSKLALELRNLINKASGNLRVGDTLFPFVKTPANVVETGLDYAGVGFLKSGIRLAKMIRSGEVKGVADAAKIFLASRDTVRSGIGVVGAILIANQIDDADFMGAYDPARAQISSLKNKNYNAIKIGNHWVSMDWFGPLAPPLTGILYAKKYGKNQSAAARAVGYGKAVGQQAFRLPVISEMVDYFKRRTFENPNEIDVQEMKKSAADSILSFFSARTVPSIIYDIAKATDPYVRETNGQLQALQSKLPGLRQVLPVKTSVLGEEIKSENPLLPILFGSRIKKEINDPVINEMDRLSEAGEMVTITDWNKSSSATISIIRSLSSDDKFRAIKKEYGQKVKAKFEEVMRSEKYIKADDADKQNMLDNAEAAIMKEYAKEYKKE